KPLLPIVAQRSKDLIHSPTQFIRRAERHDERVIVLWNRRRNPSPLPGLSDIGSEKGEYVFQRWEVCPDKSTVHQFPSQNADNGERGCLIEILVPANQGIRFVRKHPRPGGEFMLARVVVSRCANRRFPNDRGSG